MSEIPLKCFAKLGAVASLIQYSMVMNDIIITSIITNALNANYVTSRFENPVKLRNLLLRFRISKLIMTQCITYSLASYADVPGEGK